MKNKTRFALFLLAVLLLAGILPLSGGAGMQAQAKTNDSNYLVYYADVINNYKTVIKKNFYRGEPFPDDLPKYVTWTLVDYWSNYTYSSDTVYYALHDINGNGFPELLIGAKDDYHLDEMTLYGAFSYTNKIYEIASSTGWGYKVSACLFKNGIISNSISCGYKTSMWEFYKLDKNDKAKLLDTITLDETNGTKYFRGSDQKTEITKKKAEKICDRYTGQGLEFYNKTDVKLSWKKINSLPKITGLNKPTDLRVTAVNTTALNLKWNKVKGAKGYKIFCRDAATKKYVLLASSKKAAVKLTGLTPDTAYQFAVRACCKPEQKVLYSNYSALLPVKTAK